MPAARSKWSTRYRNVALPIVTAKPLRRLARVLAREQHRPHPLTDGEAAHQAILEALDRRRRPSKERR